MTMIEKINVEKGLTLDAFYRLSYDKRKAYLNVFRLCYEQKLSELMLENGLIYHHTAIHPGGIRKRNPVSAKVYPYEGRFGIGYTVHRYKEGSDNSHYVDYWIKED